MCPGKWILGFHGGDEGSNELYIGVIEATTEAVQPLCLGRARTGKKTITRVFLWSRTCCVQIAFAGRIDVALSDQIAVGSSHGLPHGWKLHRPRLPIDRRVDPA